MADATATPPRINAVPNPVDFTLDQSELEVLSLHYFTESLDYSDTQFRFPGEPTPSQDWIKDQIAAIRLDQIAAVIGDDKMSILSNLAHSDFKRRYEISDADCADFGGQADTETL